MISFRAVSAQGAVNLARARVLWGNGLLKIFNERGLVVAMKAEEPVRIRGKLNAWRVETERGPLVLRNKCLTCGGRKWWKMVYISDRCLWEKAT